MTSAEHTKARRTRCRRPSRSSRRALAAPRSASSSTRRLTRASARWTRRRATSSATSSSSTRRRPWSSPAATPRPSMASTSSTWASRRSSAVRSSARAFAATRIQQLEASLQSFEYLRPDKSPHLQYPKTDPPDGSVCPDPADLAKALQDLNDSIAKTTAERGPTITTPPPIQEQLDAVVAKLPAEQREPLAPASAPTFVKAPMAQPLGRSACDLSGTWSSSDGSVITIAMDAPNACTGKPTSHPGAWTLSVSADGTQATLSDGTTGPVAPGPPRTINWSNGIVYTEQ